MKVQISVPSGVQAVVSSANESSMKLSTTIRTLRSPNKDARELKTEVEKLTNILGLLLKTAASDPWLDFQSLEFPIRCCGEACYEYSKIITSRTLYPSNISSLSVQDWTTRGYLQGDISTFRTLLAAHKSTFTIALANAIL